MNAAIDTGPFKLSFQPPSFESKEEEQLHRKQRLAAAFRLFSKLGFDEGVAGHITVRDPIAPETFWVNPFGIHFSQIKVSNLIRVDHSGATVEGSFPVNTAAYAIHSRVHQARPDVIAAAHAHSVHGKAFSTLGKLLDPLTQDACAFYRDHALYEDFGGVVVDLDEGQRIAQAVGDKKAAILANHGLLTVGATVDAAAWWFITMERSCQAELLARAAGEPKLIRDEAAQQAAFLTGNPIAGWFQFQPLWARIVREQPDLLE
jgi:ribulose-5-phosphate 4-epimerase/fuculose-1-phosphate aldolase